MRDDDVMHWFHEGEKAGRKGARAEPPRGQGLSVNEKIAWLEGHELGSS